MVTFIPCTVLLHNGITAKKATEVNLYPLYGLYFITSLNKVSNSTWNNPANLKPNFNSLINLCAWKKVQAPIVSRLNMLHLCRIFFCIMVLNESMVVTQIFQINLGGWGVHLVYCNFCVYYIHVWNNPTSWISSDHFITVPA